MLQADFCFSFFVAIYVQYFLLLCVKPLFFNHLTGKGSSRQLHVRPFAFHLTCDILL